MSKFKHLTFLLIILFFSACSFKVDNSENEKYPSPSFSPKEVLEIQLDFFQNNTPSDDNQGIRDAFRFASPENQEATGPEDHFIAMMSADKYSILLNAEKYEIEVITEQENLVHYRVIISNRNSDPVSFIFVLGKQENDNFKDCWMTEGVVTEEEGSPQKDELKI